VNRSQVRKAALAELEFHGSDRQGSLLRQIILGGQDGLVNVLGVILGVASGTNDIRIVIIAGLAATFAESISMAAVAYTSARAEQDYYHKMVEHEKQEIRDLPEVEREEIRLIYMKKGFRGHQLEAIVKKITSDKNVWLQVMMAEELKLDDADSVKPVSEGFVVGLSATVGSFVPLTPFLMVPFSVITLPQAMLISAGVSALVLFAAGAYKARITVGNWVKSGIEMAGIGMLAALAGYAIGALAGIVL